MTGSKLLSKFIEIKRKIDLDNLDNLLSSDEINFLKDNIDIIFKELRDQFFIEDIQEDCYLEAVSEVHKVLLAIKDKTITTAMLEEYFILLSDEGIRLLADTYFEKDEIVSMLKSPDSKLSSNDKEKLLKYLNDTELIEEFIKTPALMSPISRAHLIKYLYEDNEEKLKECVEDDSLELESFGKSFVITFIKDKEYRKKFLDNSKYKWELKDIARMIMRNEGVSGVKKLLVDFKSKGYAIDEVVNAVVITRDEEYMSEFLEEHFEKLSFFLVRALISATKNKDRIREYCHRYIAEKKNGAIIESLIKDLKDKELLRRWIIYECPQIKDYPSMSVEEVENNSQIKYIQIASSDKDETNSFYERSEYVKIKKALDKILVGIRRPKKDSFASELTTFCEVFKRLSHIDYDFYASTEEGEENYETVIESRSLYGGLINGQCVCAGYAKILKACLMSLGIETRYIVGYREDEEHSGHAWNQVKIRWKLV
ncbi:MAG: hypothetical protein J6C46_09580 [Clostridia bacterium]|nr:hypothetical protein [Clostridia bacterium]